MDTFDEEKYNHFKVLIVEEEIVARTDRRKDGGDNHNIPTLFKKRVHIDDHSVLLHQHICLGGKMRDCFVK
ncbi:hypothetical protein DPMN_113389 [Dreissena polymorpha]|uniref:Uncharacterized protein n=1 Tax=Dreissena polymorpha TaxID=45954 RepID=A0A9D4KI78_DREPO|nr:hypothetical protein DPMN_113389 [Dreissena polymorpha]